MRINKSFSPPLPVNGGCPQGSLLGVLIFNVSTDDVELGPREFLGELEEEEIHVGDFFDEHDREYLRLREREMVLINENNELIPGLHLPASVSHSSSESDFESNGLSSVSFTPDAFSASTPVRSDPDLFAVGSPINESVLGLSGQSSDGEFFVETRRIIYTESETSSDNLPPDSSWVDRKLICMKYVDYCLSVEKVRFRGKEIIGGKIVTRANKSQAHFQTVEYNAKARGMKINNDKTKMLCISASKSYEPVAFLNTTCLLYTSPSPRD